MPVSEEQEALQEREAKALQGLAQAQARLRAEIRKVIIDPTLPGISETRHRESLQGAEQPRLDRRAESSSSSGEIKLSENEHSSYCSRLGSP